MRAMQHNGRRGLKVRELNEKDHLETVTKEKNIYGATTTGGPYRTIAGPCVMCLYGTVDMMLLV